jgi:hypothetical protein
VTCYRRHELAWTEALIEDIENELDASSPTKADLNRLARLTFLSPSDRINRVAGGQELDIGPELAVCTD